MSFHLGKPILVLLCIALLAGGTIALRPGQRPADVTVWVFADSHYKAFLPLIPEFEKEHNVTVNLNLLNMRAMSTRLTQMFMSGERTENAPDLVEVEIGAIGRFFRPPVDEVGFLPLNDRIKEAGWDKQIVETRFAPWSKEGVIFGIPHDVHPVTITYRHDLFWGEEMPDGTVVGPRVDLSRAKTWEEFHALCEQFTKYWRGRGYRYRHALELPEASSEYLQLMLLQRGINIVDSYGKVHLDDPRVAETLALYAQMVAGPRKIAAQTAGGGGFTRDLNDGNVCAFITADWRLTYVRRYGSDIAGKMRMMPLPIFAPGDKPTSTFGGTMIGITRSCPNPDLAWKLIDFLYFSERGIEQRRKESDILPPVKSMWEDPYYHQPDPFLGGQKGHELFTQLAHEIPARHVTPATSVATLALNNVLVRAVQHVRDRGDDGLLEQCQTWLDHAARDLEARMEHWRFE